MTDRKMFTPTDLKLSDEGYIEAAFAQLDVVDHDGDVTIAGAFPVKDVPMSAYGHTSWDGALPIGKGTLGEASGWATFKGQFFMDTTHGRDAFNTVKALGPLAEYSYGFNVLDSSPGQKDGRNVRILKSLDVFEVSPVLRGAGIGTHTLAIKSGGPGPDAPYAEHATWVQEVVKAFFDRTEAKAKWRAKAGRDLSPATRDNLSSLLDNLRTFGGTADELAAFLEATDPQKSAPPQKADRSQATSLLIEIERARSMGVPI